MQVRSLQKRTNEATSMRSKLAGFQQFTETMIAKFGQDPTGDGVDVVDPDKGFKDAQAAVALVLDFIYKMYETLLEYHNQALDKVGACSDIYKNCIIQHVLPDTTEEMVEDKKEWRKARETHETCRNDRQEEIAVENLACQKYDNYRWTNDSALLPSCAGNKKKGPIATNAFREDYLRGEEAPYPKPAWYQDNVGIMEECLEETETWINPLWELYQGCKRGGLPQCVNKAPVCRSKQHDFEQKHCEWNLKKNAICSNIYDCVKGEKKGCAVLCDGVEQDAAARAADNETGMRLECLLEVLFGERLENGDFKDRLPVSERQDALNTCKNNVYDTSFWEISCPTDWNPEHPELGELKWDCKCANTSDSLPFLKKEYYKDPPALGTICTTAEENDPSTAQSCCMNKNITTPYHCVEYPAKQEHCSVFAQA